METEILDEVNRDPETSTRVLVRQFGVHYSTIWRTINREGLYPYHFLTVNGLENADHQQRAQFCRWLLHNEVEDCGFLQSILWTDESSFTREDVFNVHNSHHHAEENPLLGVTSPSGTSDNDQEWNIVDTNKRIRSPNNNTSPHPKKPNEPSNFSSPNRYSLRDTNADNMDLEVDTEINESPPPPPIFLTSSINFITLCKNLEQITKTGGFLCKSNSKSIKINLHSASSYRVVISLFNENKLEYHTNLHHTIPTDYIKDEIEKYGFMVKNVTNVLKSQSKEPLPLFFVDLNPSPNNQDIFKINYLCFTKVKFEAPHIRRDLVQCHRCQQYGHTKSYCNHVPKCVRCGDSHTSDQCSKSKDLPTKCALCSNAHLANYRGCTVHKDLQRLRKKHQPNTISREIAQNSVSSQIQPNSHPLQEASQLHNNVPITTHNEPINTQHSSYSQAVIGRYGHTASNYGEPQNPPTPDQYKPSSPSVSV
ncbi:hypothetical protein QTP88_003625 [Uroleucon formosanum]